jgi:NAD-dependent SIR2 family protein deacetylase
MELENFVRQSRRLLVITGAGCSTGSGIGDYRDDDGEWKRVRPVQHQEFMTAHAWRQRYWARSQVGYPEFKRARPNSAHQVLARWERQGRIHGLITQNADRLHQRAGQQRVIDLHGRLDEVICMRCGDITERDAVQTWLDDRNTAADPGAFTLAPDGDADLQGNDYSRVCVPACQLCGGILKPNVVFFGDSVPKPVVEQAYQWVDEADGVLVVGSSLMVFSSFRFIRRAAQAGTPIAAINRGKTRADDLLAAKVGGECGAVLTTLAARLQGGMTRG